MGRKGMEDKLGHLPIMDETAGWKCTLSVIVFEEIILVVESKPSFHENENSNTYFQTTNTKETLFNHLESIKTHVRIEVPWKRCLLKVVMTFQQTMEKVNMNQWIQTTSFALISFFICRSNTQVYWLFSFMYCLVNFADFWHEKVTYATSIHDNRAFSYFRLQIVTSTKYTSTKWPRSS